MPDKKNYLSLLLLLIIFSFACGGGKKGEEEKGPTEGKEADLVSPAINSIFPEAEAQNVAVNIKIEVVFSEEIDENTLSAENFTLSTFEGNNPVEGKIEISQNLKQATFIPNQSLSFNQSYQVALTNAITDLAGNPLEEGKSWKFTTHSQPWIMQSPPPTNKRLSSIFFLDNNQGWLAGDEGIILSTNDGGVKWTQRESGITAPLYDLYFLDEQKGWAVGEDENGGGVILQTTDGGQSWKIEKNHSSILGRVFFLNAFEGWVIGVGTILRTTDGGEKWNPQEVKGIAGKMLGDIFFVANSSAGYSGWIVGEKGLLLFSPNAGKSWNDVSSRIASLLDQEYPGSIPLLRAVYFVNESEGWIAGSQEDSVAEERGGVILHTTDGGNTWTAEKESGVKKDLRAVYFLDTDKKGWFIGNEGIILFKGGGTSPWEFLDSGVKEQLRDLYLIGNEGWIVGDRGIILHNSDLGQKDQWRSELNGTLKKLNAVYFQALQGWAVGEEGVIVYTEDGGEKWQEQQSGTQLNLKAIYFIEQTGWIAGEGGLILKTNGEGGWDKVENIPSGVSGLNALFFTSDASTGWAVGDQGVILNSTDQGDSWIKIEVPGLTANLHSVYFIEQEGWIVGEKGTILYTNEGGNRWTTQTTGIENALFATVFADNNNGWAVGSSGIIIHTTDGGKDWNQQNSNAASTLNDIFFAGGELWAVGDNGTIVYSKDQGDNWEIQITGINGADHLNGVHFINEKEGWAVGDKGIIVHTTNGGN